MKRSRQAAISDHRMNWLHSSPPGQTLGEYQQEEREEEEEDEECESKGGEAEYFRCFRWKIW